MATFIDHHTGFTPSPEMQEQMVKGLRAGQPDAFGVRGINAFIASGGESFCLTEGPSAEAVVQSHAALGITLAAGEVKEVHPVLE